MKGKDWSEPCGVNNEKLENAMCKESIECGVWSVKCEVCSVECVVRCVECEVSSVKCGVRSVV